MGVALTLVIGKYFASIRVGKCYGGEKDNDLDERVSEIEKKFGEEVDGPISVPGYNGDRLRTPYGDIVKHVPAGLLARLPWRFAELSYDESLAVSAFLAVLAPETRVCLWWS